MIEPQMLQIGLDAGLALSLGALAWGLMHSPALQQMGRVRRQLEESISTLIRDASESSRALSAELSSERRSLERLVEDLKSADAAARASLREFEAAPLATQSSASRAGAVRNSSTATTEEIADTTEGQFIPDSEAGRLNIFGEPVIESPSENQSFSSAPSSGQALAQAIAARLGARSQSALNNAIEKQVMQKGGQRAGHHAPTKRKATETPKPVGKIETAVKAKKSTPAVREIREAAETLLRAGKDVEFVVAATQIDRGLAEKIAASISMAAADQSLKHEVISTPAPLQEAAVSSGKVHKGIPGSTADARLGVLSSMKRQVAQL